MPDDTPQVKPTLWKSILREALFGASIYAIVGCFSYVQLLSNRLDALALRLATVETIYDAESVTIDAHRNWPDDGTKPGTDIPDASK